MLALAPPRRGTRDFRDQRADIGQGARRHAGALVLVVELLQLRQHGRGKTQLAGFLEPQAGVNDRTHRAGEPDLAEINLARRQWGAGQGRNERGGSGEIGRRLVGAHASGDIEVDIMRAQLQAAMRLEHRERRIAPRA